MSQLKTSAKSVKMCRCCGRCKLAKSEQFVGLFEPEEHRLLIENIRRELLISWKFLIGKNNGLPQHICSKCLQQFDAYFNFRKFCGLAQERLTKFYQRMTNTLPAEANVTKVQSTQNTKSLPQQSVLCPGTKRRISDQLCTKQKLAVTTKTITKKNTMPNTVNAEEVENVRIILSQSKANLDIKVNNVSAQQPSLLPSIEFVELPNVPKRIKPFAKTKTDSLTANYRNNSTLVNVAQSDAVANIDKRNEERPTTSAQRSDKEIEYQECYGDDYHENTIDHTLKQIDQLAPSASKTVDSETLNFDDILELSRSSYGMLPEDEEIAASTDKERKSCIKYKRNPLACKYCCFDKDISTDEVIYPSKEALNSHIKLKHNTDTPYTCPICEKSFSLGFNCRSHILYHHKKHKTICSICGVELNVSTLKSHMDFRHTYADFQCETCGKNFENCTVARFRYHRKWHNEQKQYKCEFCPKVFVQKIHLDTHKAIHTNIHRLKCEICGKGLNSQYDKGIHMHKVHGEAKPVKCLYCDERFLIYEKRNRHMVKQHGHVQKTINEMLNCFKCNKLFRRESGLRTHMKTNCLDKQYYNEVGNCTKKQPQKPKNYSCPHCSCRFVKEAGLVKHLPLHSTEGRSFRCDTCNLNYKTQSHLVVHTRLKHTTVRPYACDVCGKTFSYRFHMNGHRKWHKVGAIKNETAECAETNITQL